MTPTMSVTPTMTPTMTMTPTISPSPTSPMVVISEWFLTGNEGLYSGQTGATYDGDGEMLFTYNSAGPDLMVTYNPNFISNSFVALRINTKNSAGVDYLPLFQSIKDNGGTVSLTQGSNTARYSLAPGFNYIFDQPTYNAFFITETGGVTQTQDSPNPFVLGQPITVTIRG
jgi:hypothetical protein